MNIGSILNESERDDRKAIDTDCPEQDCDAKSNRQPNLNLESQIQRNQNAQTGRVRITVLPPLAPPSAESSSTIASSSSASDNLPSVDYRQYPSPLLSASPSFQRVGFDPPPPQKHVLPSVDPNYLMQSGGRLQPPSFSSYTPQFQPPGNHVTHSSYTSAPPSGPGYNNSYPVYYADPNAPSTTLPGNTDSSSFSQQQGQQQQQHRYPPLAFSTIGNYRSNANQPFRMSPSIEGGSPSRTRPPSSPFDGTNRQFSDGRSPDMASRDQFYSGDYNSSSAATQATYSPKHFKSQARSARRQSWPYELQPRQQSPGPDPGLNISGSNVSGSTSVIRQSPSTAPAAISDVGDPPNEDGSSAAQEIPLVYISAARDLRTELNDMNDQRREEIEQSSRDKGMPVTTMQRIITQCCDSLSESVLNRVSSRTMPVARGLFRVPRPRNSFMIYKSTLHTCLRELERVGSSSCFGSSSIEQQQNQSIKSSLGASAVSSQEPKRISEMTIAVPTDDGVSSGQLSNNPDSSGVSAYTGNDRVGMAQFTQAIGILWQTETRNMKMLFQQLAVGESKLHRQLYPTYKFSPTSRKRAKRRPVPLPNVEPSQEDGAITDA